MVTVLFSYLVVLLINGVKMMRLALAEVDEKSDEVDVLIPT